MAKPTRRLNTLQAKTLTLLQEVAAQPMFATSEEDGSVVIRMLPEPHGDHFHVGRRVVMSSDATGLQNPAVWKALARKGFLTPREDGGLTLTPAGLAEETGLRDKILHGSDH